MPSPQSAQRPPSSSQAPSSNGEDLTDVVWIDSQWLSTFPLNQSTALHYFSLSQFYDRTCNNELINMQHLDISLLSTMAGTEYSVANPCPGLFVITKSRRTITPASLQTLAVYYIHEGCVYQAPTMHAVLTARFLQTLHHLRKAFDTMHNAAVLSTNGTHAWEPSPMPPDDAAAQDHPQLSANERSAIEHMLYDVWKKNDDISKQLREKQNQEQQQQQQQQQPQQQGQPQLQQHPTQNRPPGAGSLPAQPSSTTLR